MIDLVTRLIGSPINKKNLSRLVSDKKYTKELFHQDNIKDGFTIDQLELYFSFFFSNGVGPKVHNNTDSEVLEMLTNCSDAEIRTVCMQENLKMLMGKLHDLISDESGIHDKIQEHKKNLYAMYDNFHFDNVSLPRRVEELTRFYNEIKAEYSEIASIKHNLFENHYSTNKMIVTNRMFKLQRLKDMDPQMRLISKITALARPGSTSYPILIKL